MLHYAQITVLRLFMTIAALWTALCALGAYISSSWLVAVCACGIYGFLIPCWSVLFVLGPNSYPCGLRGVGVGVCNTMASLPGLVSPFLSAVLVELVGSEWVYMAVWTAIITINAMVAGMW